MCKIRSRYLNPFRLGSALVSKRSIFALSNDLEMSPNFPNFYSVKKCTQNLSFERLRFRNESHIRHQKANLGAFMMAPRPCDSGPPEYVIRAEGASMF